MIIEKLEEFIFVFVILGQIIGFASIKLKARREEWWFGVQINGAIDYKQKPEETKPASVLVGCEVKK